MNPSKSHQIPARTPTIAHGKRDWVCANCGHVGRSGTFVRGSFVVEIVLWLCFLLPGLIYSLWRHSHSYHCCKECRATMLVKALSPRGRKLIAEYHS